MGNLEMKGQDLLELHQLLLLYAQTYPGESKDALEGLLEGVSGHYRIRTRGKDIRSGRNPRGAGRRRVYDAGHDETIRNLHGQGLSLRRIAQESGCSVGHVQDVLRSP